MMSLQQAADAAGVAKSTVWRNIKSGTLSGTRAEDGTWSIEEVELFRVFTRPEHAGNGKMHQSATAPETEIRLLREMLIKAEAERDRWHEAAMVSLRALPASVTAVTKPRRQWWWWHG